MTIENEDLLRSVSSDGKCVRRVLQTRRMNRYCLHGRKQLLMQKAHTNARSASQANCVTSEMTDVHELERVTIGKEARETLPKRVPRPSCDSAYYEEFRSREI